MRLYIVRHAQRDFGKNFDRLNKIGKEQAKRLARYFKNKKINIVYCSPNNRAKQTYKYIEPLLKDVPVIFTKELRQHGVPKEVGTGYEFLKPEEKETEAQLEKRMKTFLQILKKKHRKDNILIIGHKEVFKSLILKILNLPSTEQKYFRLHSASVSVFEIGKNFKVKSFLINDISHLFKRH